MQGKRKWDEKTTSVLWSTIWDDLCPYWCTKIECVNEPSKFHKSREGKIIWRMHYDKMNWKGLFHKLNDNWFYSFTIKPTYRSDVAKVKTFKGQIFCFSHDNVRWNGIVGAYGENVGLMFLDNFLTI